MNWSRIAQLRTTVWLANARATMTVCIFGLQLRLLQQLSVTRYMALHHQHLLHCILVRNT
jgi:hypothetical protein